MEYNPFSRSWVKQILAHNGLFLSKNRGQNYLTDRNIAQKIIDAHQNPGNLPVFEVGTGLGALTSLLCEHFDTVSLEIDRGVFGVVSQVLKSPRLTLLNEDFLKFPLEALSAPEYGFVSNLPYSISGEAVRIFIESGKFAVAVVMLQKEFVDRMLASPGSKNYGVLAVLSQMYLKIERLFFVSPACFFPEPSVGSEVVRLHKTGCGFSQVEFRDFLMKGFAMKRKTLANNFKSAGIALTVAEAAGIDVSRRPDSLTPAEWRKLFETQKEIGNLT